MAATQGHSYNTIENKIKLHKEYKAQIPSTIVVELRPDLDPMAMIVLALIKADIRSIPLMIDIIPSRSRQMSWHACKRLEKKGYVKNYEGLWFETPISDKEMIFRTKKYWRSKRNPKGRLPKKYNGIDWEAKIKEFNNIAQKQKDWITELD